ncbi:MAG: hypothetical protein M0Z89_11170 [Nitrospiraceae bacterium]|nr:hypothetical protein [Nitrospiraceae bacterium]
MTLYLSVLLLGSGRLISAILILPHPRLMVVVFVFAVHAMSAGSVVAQAIPLKIIVTAIITTMMPGTISPF